MVKFSGKKSTPKSNLVTSVQIPEFITQGQLSLSLSFQGHPSGSLSISTLDERDIQQCRNTYSVGTTHEFVTGVILQVTNYSETEDFLFGPGISETIRTFDVSITLEGLFGDPLRSTVRYAPAEFPVVENNKILLSDIAKKAGFTFQGEDYKIDFSFDQRFATLDIVSEALSRAKLYYTYLDFNGTEILSKPFKTGAHWPIVSEDIIYTFSTSKSREKRYKDARLSGTTPFNQIIKIKSKYQEVADSVRGEGQLLPDVYITLEEGDPDYEFPPKGVGIVTDIDMNFDLSGPTKTYRKVTTRNGKPHEEVVKVYGFAFLARQIKNPAAETKDFAPPLRGNISEYWQQIEETTTSYTYSDVQVNVRLSVKDQYGKIVKVFYEPPKGSFFTNGFSTKYLTSTKTTGWKLGRFNQETLDGDLDTRETYILKADETLEEKERYYWSLMDDSLSFRRIPTFSEKTFKLVPQTEYFSEENDIPFQTNEYLGSDLGLQPFNEKFVIAVPDFNYVYPMLVLEEESVTLSYISMANPENILIREDRALVIAADNLTSQEKAAELKELSLKPDLSTGEDSIFRITRSIVPSKFTNRSTIGQNENLDYDMYVEHEHKYSASESQFKTSLQETYFREVQGRPPQGDYLQSRFGVPDKITLSTQTRLDQDYYITSTDIEPGKSYEFIYEVNFDTRFLDQALNAAKMDLELANLESHTMSLNLAWDYSHVRPGDFLDITDQSQTVDKLLMVKDLSMTFEIQGELDGQRVITCEGTQVSAGYLPVNTNFKGDWRRSTDRNLNIRPVFSSESSLDTTGSHFPTRSRRNNG